MSGPMTEYLPGSLIRARGREWVVLPQSNSEILRLRPLGGSEEDLVVLCPALEPEAPRPATFPWPDPEKAGTHDAARLLQDALKLKLRSGAGPFRSFGNIAVEPRAYQLVPLLMALRQPTARLLIADDVGIGKTIEAGLILRELFDRGEVAKAAVLCPPHLVDQWRTELRERFHLPAEVLTASTAARLERKLPHGVRLFDQYPFLIVSLDYIKSERHREHFLSMAPECVIVDEAHTCAGAGRGRQLRFELLQRLASDQGRHLLLLTATPHSGNDAAFGNLLSLLGNRFADIESSEEGNRKSLREDLARHFVQRRRKDIEEWQDQSIFPRRMTKEITYALTGPWGDFFDRVQDYCTDLAARTEMQGGQGARLVWYATLALLRCVSSSPWAAKSALTTRLDRLIIPEGQTGHSPTELENLLERDDRLEDGEAEDWVGSDLEPAARLEDSSTLKELLAEAERLGGLQNDPKLSALVSHVESLIADKFSPVVFCRYVSTAKYVAEHLAKRLGTSVPVDAVTGEFTPDERMERINSLAEADLKVLVATDCLSEGVNLQHGFNAVVHYDLAWNPTRHEQREGRVDRFGQRRPEVRATMLYGQDNPVDGFILHVILRKAEAIRQELGVLVPMPEDDQRIRQALVKAALLKRKSRTQMEMVLDFGSGESDLKPLETAWSDAMEKAKTNRTVFAQRRLKPEEVMPEWKTQLNLLGNEDDVERFVKSACNRLGAPLEALRGGTHKVFPGNLPVQLSERLQLAGMSKPQKIDFKYPPHPGCLFVHRSHPLVGLLADTLLEGALNGSKLLAARSAATLTRDVETSVVLALLRLRHQITVTRKDQTRLLLAEETAVLAIRGRNNPEWLFGTETQTFLMATPSGNLPPGFGQREIQKALDLLNAESPRLDAFAKERAQALLTDHRRVREAARDIGNYAVHASLPVDVMGVYVLLPDGL
ncbi:MAG: helicase-related protein [Fibrobacteria bacterium]